jgi:hypothetical protein
MLCNNVFCSIQIDTFYSMSDVSEYGIPGVCSRLYFGTWKISRHSTFQKSMPLLLLMSVSDLTLVRWLHHLSMEPLNYGMLQM